MAWTAPRTWVAGELITAGMFNTHIRENFNYMYGSTPLQWTTPPHLDSNYSGAATGDADWVVTAGDVATNIYSFSGRWLEWQFYIVTSTIANTPPYLRTKLPLGLKLARTGWFGHLHYYDGAGVWSAGSVHANIGVYTDLVLLYHEDTAAWVNATDACYISAKISVPVL